MTKLFVDGNPMNFYNYTIPFTWGANDLCPRGVCALTMRPGETQIISTGNYTSNPLNPCMAGTSFTAGLDYETDFAITYYASDPGALENETGNFPLIGKCTAAPA